MKDKPETLIQPTMGIKWNSGNLLDMEPHMPSTTQNNPKKEQKETTKKGGISLTIMGQRQTYNSIHNPQRSPNETLGFNQDDHPYRMCNETGIPEFLELQIPRIANSRNSYGRDGDVTCALPARSYPTRFYQRAHPTYI